MRLRDGEICFSCRSELGLKSKDEDWLKESSLEDIAERREAARADEAAADAQRAYERDMGINNTIKLLGLNLEGLSEEELARGNNESIKYAAERITGSTFATIMTTGILKPNEAFIVEALRSLISQNWILIRQNELLLRQLKELNGHKGE